MPRNLGLAPCLAALLAACAPATPPPAASGAAASASRATIVSIRPLGAPAAPSVAVVAAIAGTNGSLPTRNSAEFVLRDESGQTYSVIGSNSGPWHVGDRVTLIRGERTQIGS